MSDAGREGFWFLEGGGTFGLFICSRYCCLPVSNDGRIEVNDVGACGCGSQAEPARVLCVLKQGEEPLLPAEAAETKQLERWDRSVGAGEVLRHYWLVAVSRLVLIGFSIFTS